MGRDGVRACLNAGVNDLGGTLMNESITRAAGASHGQEWSPPLMELEIQRAGRSARMRTTLYGDAPLERAEAAFAAGELIEVENANAGKRQRSKRLIEHRAEPLRLVPGRPKFDQVVLMAACN